LEKIHQLNWEHDNRVYQKKLAEWEKDHEQLQKVREKRKMEYMENAKMKYFLIDKQGNPAQPELPMNIEEWKDDVYENPPPKEPVASEFKTTVVRKEIQKVIPALILSKRDLAAVIVLLEHPYYHFQSIVALNCLKLLNVLGYVPII
jgi:hypothetical protein